MTTTKEVTLEDLADLLTEEPADPRSEREVLAAIVGTPAAPGLLVPFVRALVDADDIERLAVLQSGGTPLHELLEHDASHREAAVRGLAALGLALVADAPGKYFEEGAAWARTTNLHVPDTRAPSDPPTTKHADRLVELENGTTDPDVRGGVLWWLRDLDSAERPRRPSAVSTFVLFDGQDGRRATLRCEHHRRQGRGLVPELGKLALFRADSGFASGLRRAWQQAGKKVRGIVTWSLDDADGPLSQVRDQSLTAAFTVLLDEIRRTRGRLRGFTALRRLVNGIAVTGGVDADGGMVGVTGYAGKLAAARSLDRIIVPAEDVPVAKREAREFELRVLGAATWREASRKARKRSWKAVARFLSAVVVIALSLTAGAGVYVERRQHQQMLRDTAAAVAAHAWELHNGDSGGLGMLLAMASDDIAAQVGETPGTFDEMARNDATLVRILRPQNGGYRDPQMSADGRFAMLRTNTGIVQIIGTTRGEIQWETAYPPGSMYSREQIHVNAMALTFEGTLAAFATSDLKLSIVRRDKANWNLQGQAPLPVSPSGERLSHLDSLAFSTSGDRIVGYGLRAGLLAYDPADLNKPPEHCPDVTDLVAVAVDDTGPLVLNEDRLERLDLGDCSRTEVLKAPQGATFVAATVHNNEVVAFSTRGAQLLATTAEHTETVIADSGPYHEVRANDSTDGTHVSGATETGTFGWLAEERALEFGRRGPGLARASEQNIVWVHDGIAEIHGRARTGALMDEVPLPGVMHIAWAGAELLMGREPEIIVAPVNQEGVQPDQAYALPQPPDTRNVFVTGDPSSPWAGAIVEDSQDVRAAVSWDLQTRSVVPVPSTDGDRPLCMVIETGQMLIGYRSGALRRFELQDGAWGETGSAALGAPVRAVAVGKGSDNVYVVTSPESTSPPTVHRLHAADLTLGESATLANSTEVAKIVILQDTQVLVSHGTGELTFFDPALNIRGSYIDYSIAVVTDLAEVPGFAQIVISGTRGSITVNKNTRTPVDSSWFRGSPFSAGEASGDGRFLALYNFMEFKLSIWSLDKGDVRARMCEAIGRDLTPDEWLTFVGDEVPYDPVCD